MLLEILAADNSWSQHVKDRICEDRSNSKNLWISVFFWVILLLLWGKVAMKVQLQINRGWWKNKRYIFQLETNFLGDIWESFCWKAMSVQIYNWQVLKFSSCIHLNFTFRNCLSFSASGCQFQWMQKCEQGWSK